MIQSIRLQPNDDTSNPVKNPLRTLQPHTKRESETVTSSKKLPFPRCWIHNIKGTLQRFEYVVGGCGEGGGGWRGSALCQWELARVEPLRLAGEKDSVILENMKRKYARPSSYIEATFASRLKHLRCIRSWSISFFNKLVQSVEWVL